MAITREQAVEALRASVQAESGRDARDHFAAEPDRLDRFTLEAAGLHFDFSKHAVSAAGLDQLLAFADAAGLADHRAKLMAGDPVNVTEGRAAQHMALRGAGSNAEFRDQAAAELQKARSFADALRSGDARSAAGSRFTHILHIGIGGSDLGPRLIHDALREDVSPVDVRFLSSVDPDAFERVVAGLDPKTTLVFIVSKSFGTPETTLNTRSALDWLRAALGDDISSHLAAATAKPEAAKAIGVPGDRIFEMWDWVGGRYSLWSAVSLSVMAAIGKTEFDALLSGAREMDRHFETAPASRNAPVLSALMAFRHRFAGCQSWAVVPYAIRLRLFCGWLQQLSMESLGKRVTADGAPLVTPAGPVVWGGEGPDGQHAFFQMLHQGTDAIPVDLVAFRSGGDGRHRQALLANAVAQAEAMLRGRSADEARAELDEKQVPGAIADRIVPHMVMPGGRSSTFILSERLDAASLGAILSFYEHQTFALSVLLGVNAFDQFGVELGKKLAKAIEKEWDGGGSGAHDASTLALMNRLKG